MNKLRYVPAKGSHPKYLFYSVLSDAPRVGIELPPRDSPPCEPVPLATRPCAQPGATPAKRLPDGTLVTTTPQL